MQLYGWFTIQAWWICLVVLIVMIFVWKKSWIRACLLAFRLPGPPALPFLGNIFEIKDGEQFIKFEKTAYKLYGPLIRGWITLIPVVAVIEPNYLQVILGNNKQTEKSFLYSFMKNFLGSGLTTINGSKWKSHKKYIQPYFTLTILNRYIDSFSEGAQILIKKLENEHEIEVTKFINDCTLSILHQTILGIPFNDHKTKEQSSFNKGHVVILERILRPWQLLDFVYNYSSSAKQENRLKLSVNEFTKMILEQRRRKPIHQWCLLDAFLEISQAYPDFTNDDIVDEICTFIFAGQESVGGAVSFALYYLAKHEDIQEKVVQELKTVFEDSNNINMESLNKMKYLEKCINETLRLCPTIPLFMKKLTEDIKLGKHTFPAGLNVLIVPFVTHRLPHYYPDPEKFDPDRFSPQNKKKLNAFAHIPFSAGPRSCIGYKFAMLEMKTIISTILWHYKISSVPGSDLRLSYEATLRAKGGIHVKLHLRQNII